MILLFLRLSRPVFLLGGILLYALGVGIAKYLGATIDWGIYALGQLWVTLLQLSAHYLNEYYDAPVDDFNANRTPFSGGSGMVSDGKVNRNIVLVGAAVCLTGVASLSVMLMQSIPLNLTIILIMIIALIGAIFYSVPPIRLLGSGYGELTTSVLVANLLPVFSFMLQTGEFHHLLGMSTFPLTLMHLSMMLSLELPDSASDLLMNKRTLMIRLGWKNGTLLHNILILSTYLLFGLAMVFGFPIFIGLPVYFTLPLGILQIWQIKSISDGKKPNWRSLTLGSVVLFSAAAYMLTYSFWTR